MTARLQLLVLPLYLGEPQECGLPPCVCLGGKGAPVLPKKSVPPYLLSFVPGTEVSTF